MSQGTKHDCVARINALLKEHNTKLAEAIAIGSDRECIVLATSKADEKLRKKPALLFATFCPMCGVKLKGAA